MDIKEVVNGIVHPVTNELIMKYNKINEGPLLCDIWMKAMYVEVGQMTQGYKDVKGMETIKFIILDEIPNIP